MVKFHIGDVLSITTGKMVSPTGMDGIYKILNFMTGEDLYTHQLPRAMRVCAPHLLQQHPQLAEVQTIDTEISESDCDVLPSPNLAIMARASSQPHDQEISCLNAYYLGVAL